MPFVARFGFLWMFPFEHRIARCGILLVRKATTSNKWQKSPNGNQASHIHHVFVVVVVVANSKIVICGSIYHSENNIEILFNHIWLFSLRKYKVWRQTLHYSLILIPGVPMKTYLIIYKKNIFKF